MTLRVKKLHPDAVIPTRTSPHSVGYDLYSMEDITVPSMDRRIVSTGVCATLPPGVYGRIAPRSGMTLKYGIQTGAGVVDPDFTGELVVVLFNFGSEDFEIKRGNRIAQMILERCETPLIEEVIELTETERGDNGFGWSGA
tara:strand:- start:7872 stop:8294 length:423 start_codon:yes stop_codon:yes gene_type:complete